MDDFNMKGSDTPAPLAAMRMLALTALCLGLVGLGPPGAAQPVDRQQVVALVEQMLDAGADGAALADLGHAPVQGEMVDAIGAQRSELLHEAWTRAFAPAAVRADVAGFIADRKARADVEAALEWLRRPEVARVTARMREGSGPEFDRAFGEWMLRVRNGEIELDEARLETIVLIGERSGEERIGGALIALAEASIRGAHAIAPRADRPPLDPALDRLRAVGPTLAAQAAVQNQLYLYYVLQDLSPSQLEAYAGALDRRAGRWYVGTMADAVEQAIGRAGERLLAEVRQTAPRR